MITTSGNTPRLGDSIDVLGLSRRVSNALHRYDIHTIGDLVHSTPQDVLDINQLGANSLTEVITALGVHGLALKEPAAT